MKSLAKIVAMGLVMSSVPVMGAWAKDLVVTERSQWDYKNSSYSYRAYTPFLHTDNNFHDVTIFMDGKEQNAQDAKDEYSIPFDAVNHDDANFPDAIFKAYILKIAAYLNKVQTLFIQDWEVQINLI